MYVSRKLPKCNQKLHTIMECVRNLLRQCTIQLVFPEGYFQGFYSPLSFIGKIAGDLWSLLDSKALNKRIKVLFILVESLPLIVQVIHPGNWFLSIVANLHILIDPQFPRFPRLSIFYTHFHIVTLLFSLSTSPRTFNKMLFPVIALIHQQGFADLLEHRSVDSNSGEAWLDHQLKE